MNKYSDGRPQHKAVTVIEGDLTVDRACALKRILLNAVEGSGTAAISFRENQKVDISFLQLLCSARLSALASGRKLELVDNIPESLTKTILFSGFARHLEWDFNINKTVRHNGGENE